MKVEKKSLKEVLNKVGIFAKKESAGVVGACVLFKNEDKKLTISGTDGNNICMASMTTDEVETVSFVTTYKALLSAVLLRDKEVELIKTNNVLNVKDSKTQLDYAVTEEDTFSFNAKQAVVGDALQIKASDLKEAISKVEYARDEKDTSRPFITGVSFTVAGGKLTLIAADGKRIASTVMEIGNPALEMKGILTTKNIQAINIFDDEKMVNIYMNENSVRFEMDGLDIYMQKLACAYPDMSKFTLSTSAYDYIVTRKEIIESLNIVSAVEDKFVEVTCDEKKISFSAKGSSGSINDEIACERTQGTEVFKFMVNVSMFTDLFKNLKTEKLTVRTKGEGAPVGCEDGVGSWAVVMPIKRNQ